MPFANNGSHYELKNITQPHSPIGRLFVWLVADGWCWFVLRKKFCWLVVGGWFILREK
jgi:hypothetical protein